MALNDLITVTNPRSPISEAFRTLRTNLEFSSLDHPLHTMVVTTATPEEGKSTTLANLAVIMAEGGKRVILVDCDLRRPALHDIFGIPNDEGLTAMLRNNAALNAPPLQEVGIEGLSLLPSGPLPADPVVLLGSRRMGEVIATLKERADLVLFDAPPVVAVTDAAVLAARTDGVLLLLRAGSTRREYAQRAKELLEKVNVRIIGAVLCNAPFDATFRRYYAT
ncbi:MAG: CpsD/CapB family tyrosine-protein kinase [Anaerolineae bacterium]|nr:CpsD/CapB family tyrosine-protein kinase [Anaerolineae bacterium]